MFPANVGGNKLFHRHSQTPKLLNPERIRPGLRPRSPAKRKYHRVCGHELIFFPPLEDQVVRTAAEHLMKPATYLEINPECVEPFQPQLENHRGADIAGKYPATRANVCFHAKLFKPSAKIVWRKPLYQSAPPLRMIVALSKLFEGLAVRDIQTTPAGYQKFSTRGGFLVKNRRANALLSNYFRGPQPRRPCPDDNSKGSVQRLSSNIRMIGSSARRRNVSGNKISGARFESASRSFSKVFFFMNRQSAQAHVSVGPAINVFPGSSFF